MLAVFKKELKGYFTCVIGYVFLVLFLAVAAAAFCYTTLFAMSADVSSYFTIMLILCAVMLPILTMKSFSEERKMKTEQLLMTSPLSITSMVMGKLLACYAVFSAAVIFTSLYFLILTPYAILKVNLLIGNIVALLLVGLVFISIGLFVSSLTENQLSAAIGTMGIILAFLAIGLIGSFIPTEYWIRSVFDALSVMTRFGGFTAGYFALSSVVYYLSVSAVFVYLTVRVFDRRRYD